MNYMFKKFPPMWGSSKWTRGFMISHILGWTLANIQTIWIIWEIRALRKRVRNLKNMK
jgi:hypothetical protein